MVGMVWQKQMSCCGDPNKKHLIEEKEKDEIVIPLIMFTKDY